MLGSRDRRQAQSVLPLQPDFALTAMDPLGFPNTQSRAIVRPPRYSYGNNLSARLGSVMQTNLLLPRPSELVQQSLVIADAFPFPTDTTTNTADFTASLGFSDSTDILTDSYSGLLSFAISDNSFFSPSHPAPSAAFAGVRPQDLQVQYPIEEPTLVGTNTNPNIDLGLVSFDAPGSFLQPQNLVGPSPWPLNSTPDFETFHPQPINPSLITDLAQLPNVNGDNLGLPQEWLNSPLGPIGLALGDMAMQPQPAFDMHVHQPNGAPFGGCTAQPSPTSNEKSPTNQLPMGSRIDPNDDAVSTQCSTNDVSPEPSSSDLESELVRQWRKNVKNAKGKRKGRKKGPLNEIDRKAAKETRKMKACTRCHLFKIRCFPDPHDPRGGCLTCRGSNPNTILLPCFRLKITDIQQFFRLGPSDDFIKAKRWLNESWDDESTWYRNSGESDMILTQGYGRSSMRLKIKRFYPRHDDTLERTDGSRHLSYTPYAIASRHAAIQEIKRHIASATQLYIDSFLMGKSMIVKRTFSMIRSTIDNPEQIKNVDLLKDTLDLWVATRFIEKAWEVPAAQTLDRNRTRGAQVPDSVPVSPVMDHQLDQIIIKRILMPLKNNIQKRLQGLVVANKRENWFIIFLCTFLMLHNYEIAIVHDRNFARNHGLQTSYTDKKLIEAYHAGAKTLLIHFKYCCKGHVAFQNEKDDKDDKNEKNENNNKNSKNSKKSGNSKKNEKPDEFAPFTKSQKVYIKDMAEYIAAQADYLQGLESCDQYDAELHLVSKMFNGHLDRSNPFKNML